MDKCNSIDGWTIDELKRIKEALTRYGSQQHKEIRDVVKTRTLTEVKEFLRRCYREYLKEDTETEEIMNIQKWISSNELLLFDKEDHSKLIHQVFREFASEQHTVQAIDLKKIYLYIANLLTGESLPIISRKESLLIYSLLERLEENIDENDFQPIKEVSDIVNINKRYNYRKDITGRLIRRSDKDLPNDLSEEELLKKWSSIDPFCITDMK